MLSSYLVRWDYEVVYGYNWYIYKKMIFKSCDKLCCYVSKVHLSLFIIQHFEKAG